MIQQLLTISRHTFVESIRQPVLVVLIMAAALWLVLSTSLTAFTLGDDNKFLIDIGFSTLLMTGLLMGAFTATGVLTRELENKTALTVISKPVARPVFLLGKYLGVSGAIAVAFWALCAIFLLTVRHQVMQTAADQFDGPVLLFGMVGGAMAMTGAVLNNYYYHRTFTSTFVLSLFVLMNVAWILVLLVDKHWRFQSPLVDLRPQLLLGLLLVFQAVLILVAVAVAASTRLGQIMTLLVCVSAMLLGMHNDYLLGGLADQHPLARVFYMVIPNLQLFWPADAVTQGHPFTAGYMALVAGYTLLYSIALMALAVAMFQHREIC